MKIVADENIPFVAECFSCLGQVQTISGRDITPEIVRDADALIVRSITKVGADLLQGSSVKFVGTSTIGKDHIDEDYLAENQIGFASAPGSNANSDAEYVIAGLLQMSQKLNIEIQGKSLGIVGVGNVGSRVAEKAEALGMDLFLNDPPLARETGDDRYLQLDALFDCDFITLHTPLTFEGRDKTYHLADEEFFSSLKDGCVFFNTSRGPVAETKGLKNAIKVSKLSGAVIDVWENEPMIDEELLEMVDLATPHIAGYSYDGKVIGMIMIYAALCRHFGLEESHAAESFLPEPPVSQIRLDGTNKNGQQALIEAIAKIYDITNDDAALREMLSAPQEKKGSFFDNLRKNYGIRREFGNTTVICQNISQNLTAKIAGIGFKVCDD
jgi:erythronate-4-phosphate dehydrogenase